MGSASMEASMSDGGTPVAGAHDSTPAMDSARPISAPIVIAVPAVAPVAPNSASENTVAVPAEMAQYAVQLRSMRELGFFDSEAFDALVAAGGNINAAVTALLERSD
jgi:hypothetical protein